MPLLGESRRTADGGISGQYNWMMHTAEHSAPIETLLANHRAFLRYLERRVGDRTLAEDIVKVFAEQKGLSSSNAAVRVFRAREASGTP